MPWNSFFLLHLKGPENLRTKDVLGIQDDVFRELRSVVGKLVSDERENNTATFLDDLLKKVNANTCPSRSVFL